MLQFSLLKRWKGRNEMLEGINNLFRLKTLKRRLRFWFILLLLIFVVLSYIPFTKYAKEFREMEAQNNIKQMINLQQMMIEKWFDEKSITIQTISKLPVVKSGNKEKIKEALEIYDNNLSEFNGISFANAKGLTEIDTTSGPAVIDLSDRIYFHEAKKGRSYMTDVLIGRQSHQPIIIFSSPVFDYNQQFQGLVVGAVRLNTINEVMKKFRLNDTGQTYLVNRDGQLITELRFPSQPIQQGAKDGFTKKFSSTILDLAMEDKPITHSYNDYRGIPVFGDYRWVNDEKWLIIGEISKEEIFAPFHRMVMIVLAVILVVILVGLIITFLISNQIERIFHHVLEGAHAIGKAEYGYRIAPASYTNYSIELQELCETFNGMAEMIQFQMHSVQQSQEQFRLLAENSSDMITLHDTEGRYLYTSPACKEILQYEEKELLGKYTYLFIHPDDQEHAQKNMQLILETGYTVVTYRIRRKDGEYVWFESAIKLLQGTDNEDSKLIVVSRNINERKLAEQKLQEANELLQHLSSIDGLTGISNRRTFDERVEIEWKRSLRNSKPISLIMFDIDYFKAYNDTYGHQGGDGCLKQVAAVVEKTLGRASDLLCRYGGEEFSVILPETDEAGAVTVGEKIRKAIEDIQIPHAGSKINSWVTVSVGTATIVPTSNIDLSTLISNADKAVYEAKKTGRNSVRAYKK